MGSRPRARRAAERDGRARALAGTFHILTLVHRRFTSRPRKAPTREAEGPDYQAQRWRSPVRAAVRSGRASGHGDCSPCVHVDRLRYHAGARQPASQPGCRCPRVAARRLAPHPGAVSERPSCRLAVRIARAASIPVLLIHDADGLLRWARGDSLLRVMVALGRSPGSRAALGWLAELQRGRPCEALLAHVSSNKGQESPSDGGAETPAHPYRGTRREAPLDALDALRYDLRRLGVSITETRVKDAHALEELAQQEAIDLVVVPRDLPRGRPWSRRVWSTLFQAPLPGGVVCVPPDYVPSKVARVRRTGVLARVACRPARGGRRRSRAVPPPAADAA